MATYPSTQKARIAYWQRQIDYATQKLKPVFDASDVLIKQYENQSSTAREANSESLNFQEGHVSRTKSNLIFGWIDQSIANLLERNPHFQATPQTPDSAKGGKVVSHITNYWYRETNQLHQDERCLLDAFLCPYGVKKLGWSSDVEQRLHDMIDQPGYDFEDDVEGENSFMAVGDTPRVTDTQDHSLHIESHTQALQDPLLPPEAPDVIDAHIKQHQRLWDRAQPDADSSVSWEAPFGQRWDPSDFLIDPYAQDGLKDARWIAFRWRKPVDDVKANPNYENTSGLEPTERAENAPDMDPDLVDDDFGLVVGYEVWARDFPTSNGRRNLLMVFAEGHDQVLRYEEEWPYETLDDYPCELLTFHGSIKSWYTKPGLVLAGADTVQALVNEFLDSFLSTARKSKNVILFDPESVEKDEIDAILNAPDMSAFPVRGLSRGAGVTTLQFGNPIQGQAELMNLLQMHFDRSAGTPQPVALPSQDTATEASIHDRRTTAREARRGNLLAEFQINTVRKFWHMTCQFRPDRMFLIHPKAEEWVTVDDEIVKGEYRFRINVTSQATAKALERKQWSDLLNLFAGLTGVFQQLYGQPPNLARLAERLLVHGYDDGAPEEILPMIAAMNDESALGIEEQAAIAAMMAGTPAQAPDEGPALDRAPRETEPGNRVGAAMPRMFREGAPSEANAAAAAQGV